MTPRRLSRWATALVLFGLTAPALAACGTGGAASTSATSSWSTVTSAAAGGGMAALIAAARKEGQLNIVSLPADWANYGAIISAFTKKYGIKVTDSNPQAPAQTELTAIQTLRGDARAPDAVDVTLAQVGTGMAEGLFAPYKTQQWSTVPASQKNPDGYWANDYGGYISFGYNADVIKTPPTSWADLEKPAYKNEVGLAGGDPTAAGDAFASVYSAAIANGGSLTDIQPGITYFQHLKTIGNLVPIDAQPATVETGQTPILIGWDFEQAIYVNEFKARFPWKFVIPADGSVGEYYVQAISKYAPHPAAARLWEEFLFSNEGQNLYLEGHTRPVRFAALNAAHALDQAAANELPQVPESAVRPNASQIAAAKKVVDDDWSQAVG
jgi:putative spermidine/putrescine transport system substrate-binding protein